MERKGQPYDLWVQLIEADRLSSPNRFDTLDDRIIGGVETDRTRCADVPFPSMGKVIAYHFSKHHPLSLASQPMDAPLSCQIFIVYHISLAGVLV